MSDVMTETSQSQPGSTRELDALVIGAGPEIPDGAIFAGGIDIDDG